MSSYRARQDRKRLQAEVTQLRNRVAGLSYQAYVATKARHYFESEIKLEQFSYRKVVPNYASMEYLRSMVGSELARFYAERLPLPRLEPIDNGRALEATWNFLTAIPSSSVPLRTDVIFDGENKPLTWAGGWHGHLQALGDRRDPRHLAASDAGRRAAGDGGSPLLA